MAPPGITVPAWAGSVLVFIMPMKVAKMRKGINDIDVFLWFFLEIVSPTRYFVINFSYHEKVYSFFVI